MGQDPSATQRLLAIDDSSDSAELVARVATVCAYEARAASDSRSLRTVIANYRPDMITLDLCMPGTDGIDLISILQETHFTGSLMIISGQEDWFRTAVTKLAEARGLKVVGDLQKPFDIGTLRASLTAGRCAGAGVGAHQAA